jgi:hypothetical protein
LVSPTIGSKDAIRSHFSRSRARPLVSGSMSFLVNLKLAHAVEFKHQRSGRQLKG